MKKFIATLALLASLVVGSCQLAPAAEVITRDADGNSITLRDAACTDAKVLRFIPPAHRSSVRAGVTVFERKTYSNCWFIRGDVVFVIDEDGDAGVLPASGFTPVVLI